MPSRMTNAHVYEVRPRKDKRGVDLISDVLPFGRLWYDGPTAASNAIGYASHYSRSHGAVIRVYDDVGNVIQAHEHPKQLHQELIAAGVKCDFREPNVIRVAPTPLYNTFHEAWRFARLLAAHK